MPKQTFRNLPEEKRILIFNAALQIFAKHLYQDISINTVIKSLGIPTGSFYQYFTDKKDLYFYLISVYMEDAKEESIRTGRKINIIMPNRPKTGSGTFPETLSKPYYREVFIQNFNLAPSNIKRDWTFEMLINGNFIDIYDFSPFGENIPHEMKKLLLSLALAVPSVVWQFTNRTEAPEQYLEYYKTCINVLYHGLISSGFAKDDLCDTTTNN